MKLVLDVDTGIDDAVAIAYALASPEAEVLGIGTVHGNTEVEKATENTLKVLKVMGREDVPVAMGAHTPLLRPLVTALWVQGDDGLGNTNMPPSGLSVSGEHAVDQIIRLAREYPGEVTLVPVGRMTNLALALIKEPELPHLIKQVVAMAGTVVAPGNVGAMTEANVWGDPEAAKIVFGAGWPITMVGLDVTMQALLLEKHLDSWRATNTPLTQWIERILEFYFGYYSASLGFTACAMHDSVAVGVALGLVNGVEAHTLPVSVSTEDGPTLGQTLVDRRPLVSKLYTDEGLRQLLGNLAEHHQPLVSSLFPTDRGNTQVIMDIDAAGFIDHLVERIGSYKAG
ncbi:MAG: nucleoside hydrolase [Chloroflexota bacterium]|nr:nucleoside hydrolase [Chloroflexota bacterium]